jgi:hypothetical protein
VPGRPGAGLKSGRLLTARCTPTVELDEEAIERPDSLRVEDEIVTELINIYGAEELTLFHSGD